MTNDLLMLQQTIVSEAMRQNHQEQLHRQSFEQAQSDESFNQLLSRLDNLRQLARNKGTRRKLREKVQTSFAF
ncbi:hypothetical protein [Aliiglaciecola litoralis]|uniref:Uncharacterized protein n=1 Tax=Aliiglaciecola litoralis TaxID=582857 RepID=A0ABN1LHU1_9ALTE